MLSFIYGTCYKWYGAGSKTPSRAASSSAAVVVPLVHASAWLDGASGFVDARLRGASGLRPHGLAAAAGWPPRSPGARLARAFVVAVVTFAAAVVTFAAVAVGSAVSSTHASVVSAGC